MSRRWRSASRADQRSKAAGERARQDRPIGPEDQKKGTNMSVPIKNCCIAAMALLAGLATPLHAQDSQGQGSVQVKLLATAVLPDGKITRVNTDLVGLPAGTQTKANDNYVPTVAIEYFLTDQISFETICCLTQHDVDAVSGLPGAELVANAKVIPATVTAKYHFDLGSARPYVGAGRTYFIWPISSGWPTIQAPSRCRQG